jgi:tetratricopeptide (TPR) repeat protein
MMKHVLASWALMVAAPALAQTMTTTTTTRPNAPASIRTTITPAPVATAPVTTVPASPALQTAFTQSPAYLECTKLAASNPTAAEQKALAWLQLEDGIGAHHCRAMAFYGQRRFAEAAQELETVRTRIAPQNLTLRSFVARQGAKAWVDAGRPDAAIALFSTQIGELAQSRGDNVTESKLTTDLLLDRARLRITYGQLSDAVQDLDHAVSLSPANEEVLIERAGAFKQLGDLALAKQDVALVLRLNPANPKAMRLQQTLNDTTASVPAGQALKPLQ